MPLGIVSRHPISVKVHNRLYTAFEGTLYLYPLILIAMNQKQPGRLRWGYLLALSTILLVLVILALLLVDANSEQMESMEDNFGNPANTESYDTGRWELYAYGNPPHEIAQYNGVLSITQTAHEESAVGLHLGPKGSYLIQSPVSFRARLRLDEPPDPYGNVQIHLWSDGLAIECKIDRAVGERPVAMCHAWPRGKSPHISAKIPVQYGTWHAFQIDFDPMSGRAVFNIDDDPIETYVIPKAHRPAMSSYLIGVGVWGRRVKGAVDDVSVTPLHSNGIE